MITDEQEVILIHKLNNIMSLMQLNLKEQQNPKPVKQEPVSKPARYDLELNRIDYKLIRKRFDKYDKEQAKLKAKSQDAQLERIAKLQEESARWQKFLALNPPKPETVFVTPSPPPELIKKIEAYIVRAEAFIRIRKSG